MIGSTPPRVTTADAREGAPTPRGFPAGDHLALDFLNSSPTPLGVGVDCLRDGMGLVHWLERAGVIGERDARRIRGDADARAGLDEVAERARALREWLCAFVVRHAGSEVGEEAAAELAPLNDLLERGTSYWQIELGGEAGATSAVTCPPCLRRMQKLTTLDHLLQPVALSIADLVTHEDFHRIRACEGKACGQLFLHRKKPRKGRRRGATLCDGCSSTSEFIEMNSDLK